ncbi:DUF1700 domain-containing protein [Spiroplasma endosymbiont of Panorpa germanica]|uniref:DUF1700 domain-containing protein n=1 Tax=Spiroplasma endosymbiont of Panorpa germanica TaxID=3066314 RepID=UPI0030CBAF1F
MEKITQPKPGKLEAKFKRKKDKWLKELSKSLSLLKAEDREDIVNSYNEKISIELSEGSIIEDILESIESIDVISNNVYEELGVDPAVAKARSQKPSVAKTIGAYILNVFNLFFGIILPMGLALTFFLVAIAMMVAIVPYVVFMFINYDFIKALPLVIAGVGALPILMILSWYSMIGFYHLGIIGTNGSLILLSSEKRVKSKVKKLNVFSRIVLIIVLVTFTTLATAGSIATFVGPNSLGNSVINNTYFYEVSTTLVLEEEVQSNKELTKSDFELRGFPHGNGVNFIVNDERDSNDKGISKVEATFKHSWREVNIGELHIDQINSSNSLKFRIELDFYSWTILVASIGSPALEVNIN